MIDLNDKENVKEVDERIARGESEDCNDDYSPKKKEKKQKLV